jgi:hypothetical protein
VHIYHHFNERFNEEFEKDFGKTPDYLTIKPNLLIENENIDYEDEPDKFYPNYKDIYEFKDFTISNVFENPYMYVSVHFALADREDLTLEEKIQMVQEKTNELLTIFPKANLSITLYWDTAEDWKYYYYFQGKQVNELKDKPLDGR